LKGEEREREETREGGRERMGKQGREGGDEGGRDRTFDVVSGARLRPPPAPSASFLCPLPSSVSTSRAVEGGAKGVSERKGKERD
jgi:hypothetical protein